MSIIQKVKAFISRAMQRALGIDAVYFNSQVALERLGKINQIESELARIHEALINLRLSLTWDLQTLQRSGLFDDEFYCGENPAVTATGMSPIEHYLRVGANEGRRPNPLFDSAFYLATNSEVAKAGLNPAVHYYLSGASAGRDPSPEFDTSFYLETNPEIVPSGLNPLVHYLRYGAREGRLPVPAERYMSELQRLVRLAAPGRDQERLSDQSLVPLFIPARETPPMYVEAATFSPSKPSVPRNLVFVSHCDFRGNSAMHLFSIANVLTDLGHSCAVCVPEHPESVLDHGKPRFQVVDYDQAARHGVTFADRRGPDLVHAWTPRELVRKATMSIVQRYNIPYFVHLEDNEVIILLDRLPGWSLDDLRALPIHALDRLVGNQYTHPQRSARFLRNAAGMTVLIDRLLELKPQHVPGIVFFPGCDAEFAKISERDENVRTALGILPDELLVVYTGNVHHSNFDDVRNLLIAIALVNGRGFRVKLVKTGWNMYVLSELSDPEIAQHVIDRGFVARSEIPRLVAAADMLVQPGRSSEFNDYRFPAKLPEFLASGKPVILPRSNIGLLLKDGEEALLLKDGSSAEIAGALQRLAADQDLRTRIGHNGRAFALRNLDWAKNASALPAFYDTCLARKGRAVEVNPCIKTVVPKLVAFYPPQIHLGLQAMGSEMARLFGVYGFGFYCSSFGKRSLARPLDIFLERGEPAFPFLVCWVNGNGTPGRDYREDDVLISEKYDLDFSTSIIRELIPIMKDHRYIRVGGAPVLLVYRPMLFQDPRATAELWRGECKISGISALHLVAVQAHEIEDPRQFGFDAKMEFLPAAGESFHGPEAASGKYLGGNPGVLPGQPISSPILYFGVKSSIAGSSAGGYQAQLRRVTARAMASAKAQEPLIFVDGRSALEANAVLEPDVHQADLFLEATRTGMVEGLADHLRTRGVGSEQEKLPDLSLSEEDDHVRMIIQAMCLGVPANLVVKVAT